MSLKNIGEEEKARRDQKVVDHWCMEKAVEFYDASKHQQRISYYAFNLKDKEAGTAHYESSKKFAQRCNLMKTKKFKSIAEAEKATNEIR